MQGKRGIAGPIFKGGRNESKASILIHTLIISALTLVFLFNSLSFSDIGIRQYQDRDRAANLEKDLESTIIETIYSEEFQKEFSKFLYRQVDLHTRNLYFFNNNMEFNNKNFTIRLMESNSTLSKQAIFSIEKTGTLKDSNRKVQGFCTFYNKDIFKENGLIAPGNSSYSMEEINECIKGITNNLYNYVKNIDGDILDLQYANEARYSKKGNGFYQLEVCSGGLPFINNFSKPELIIINNLDKECKMDFIIEEKMDSKAAMGLLVINGDLIVEKNFNFQGVILMNGGDIILKNGSEFLVTGQVISRKPLQENDNLTIKFDHRFLIKYGILLPGFVDINLICLRNGGI